MRTPSDGAQGHTTRYQLYRDNLHADNTGQIMLGTVLLVCLLLGIALKGMEPGTWLTMSLAILLTLVQGIGVFVVCLGVYQFEPFRFSRLRHFLASMRLSPVELTAVHELVLPSIKRYANTKWTAPYTAVATSLMASSAVLTYPFIGWYGIGDETAHLLYDVGLMIQMVGFLMWVAYSIRLELQDQRYAAFEPYFRSLYERYLPRPLSELKTPNQLEPLPCDRSPSEHELWDPKDHYGPP